MQFIVDKPFEYATLGGLPDQTLGFIIVKYKSPLQATIGSQTIEGPAYLVPAHVCVTVDHPTHNIVDLYYICISLLAHHLHYVLTSLLTHHPYNVHMS